MIGADYARLMARYNRWQNDSLIAAANGLDDAARRADRGAFFGSIQATLSHLLWADTMWMSRFDGGPAPEGGIAGSPVFVAEWENLRNRRAAMDERIDTWAAALEIAPGAVLRWHSGALGRDVERPLALCVVHFFNHQTHHRGQVHAMLTAAGVRPEATDLFAMPGLD